MFKLGHILQAGRAMKTDTSSEITTLKRAMNLSNLNDFELGFLLGGEQLASIPHQKQIVVATARYLENYSVARGIKLQTLYI